MNKYQEALDYLAGELKACDDAISDFEYRQELTAKREVAEKELRKLVDKVTPKKPTKKIINVYMGEIPSEQEFHYYCKCGEWVGDEYVRQKYCPNCGQAIDWSEEE